jgi:hypothetical protein
MRRLGLALLWLLVTAAATFVAWRAVDAADNDVSEQPVFPVEAVAGATSSVDGQSNTTDPPRRTSTTGGDSNGTSGSSTSSTSSTSGSSSTSSTSSSSTSSTSTSTSTPGTTPSTTTERRSVSVAGGTVVVEASGGAVSLVSAVPNPGYSVEVDEHGPDEVRVEFESDDSKSEVRVRWNGGWDIEERDD